MKSIDEEAIGVWVGLDWADEEPAYALRISGSSKIETGDVKQTPEALQSWINELRQRSGGGWVAIAVEQSRGALLYALMDYDFVLIYPINPKSLSNYRKAFYPSGSKDDPRDADLVLDYLFKHRERIQLWQPRIPGGALSAPVVRATAQAGRSARGVDQSVDRQLEELLSSGPEMGRSAQRQDGLRFSEPLAQPSGFAAGQAGHDSPLFQEPSGSGPRKVATKARRDPAGPGTDQRCVAIVTAASLLTQSLAAQIPQLNESIQRFDAKIEELFNNHPDPFIFNRLPGSGKALAPRLFGVFGEDRDRFQSAAEVQTVSGVAPLQRNSGKTRIVCYRWACPKFVRQGVHEFAAHSRHWCPWGASFLSDEGQPRKRSSCRGALFGLQVAAHHLPLLEEPGPL